MSLVGEHVLVHGKSIPPNPYPGQVNSVRFTAVTENSSIAYRTKREASGNRTNNYILSMTVGIYLHTYMPMHERIERVENYLLCALGTV